jgi:iron(III) transport system ATP-binding protein
MINQSAKALRVTGLKKSFRLPDGRVATAVRDFNLEVKAGEFLSLLGPSGCGKTTVLRMLAGLENPDSGEIKLDGHDITGQASHQRSVGMVFQNYALFPHMTVFENVAYSFRIRGTPDAKIRIEVALALKAVGLDTMASRMPGQLSGGQQQRVALARAFVMHPDLLLFDEPLSNLDAKLRIQVRGELRRLQRRLGTTSLYVTHDQVEAMRLSDRIVVMREGQVEQIGTPEEIYNRPANLFVADFVGRINAFPGRVVSSTSEFARVETLNYSFDIPQDRCPSDHVMVLVRPEAVRICDIAENGLQGIVEEVEYCGAQNEYQIRIGETLISLVENAGRQARAGDRVGLHFVEGALHILAADKASQSPAYV